MPMLFHSYCCGILLLWIVLGVVLGDDGGGVAGEEDDNDDSWWPSRLKKCGDYMRSLMLRSAAWLICMARSKA